MSTPIIYKNFGINSACFYPMKSDILSVFTLNISLFKKKKLQLNKLQLNKLQLNYIFFLPLQLIGFLRFMSFQGILQSFSFPAVPEIYEYKSYVGMRRKSQGIRFHTSRDSGKRTYTVFAQDCTTEVPQQCKRRQVPVVVAVLLEKKPETIIIAS